MYLPVFSTYSQMIGICNILVSFENHKTFLAWVVSSSVSTISSPSSKKMTRRHICILVIIAQDSQLLFSEEAGEVPGYSDLVYHSATTISRQVSFPNGGRY